MDCYMKIGNIYYEFPIPENGIPFEEQQRDREREFANAFNFMVKLCP